MTKAVIYTWDGRPICIVDVSGVALKKCWERRIVSIRVCPNFEPKFYTEGQTTTYACGEIQEFWLRVQSSEIDLRKVISFFSSSADFERKFSIDHNNIGMSYEQVFKRRSQDLLIRQLQRALECV